MLSRWFNGKVMGLDDIWIPQSDTYSRCVTITYNYDFLKLESGLLRDVEHFIGLVMISARG